MEEKNEKIKATPQKTKTSIEKKKKKNTINKKENSSSKENDKKKIKKQSTKNKSNKKVDANKKDTTKNKKKTAERKTNVKKETTTKKTTTKNTTDKKINKNTNNNEIIDSTLTKEKNTEDKINLETIINKEENILNKPINNDTFSNNEEIEIKKTIKRTYNDNSINTKPNNEETIEETLNDNIDNNKIITKRIEKNQSKYIDDSTNVEKTIIRRYIDNNKKELSRKKYRKISNPNKKKKLRLRKWVIKCFIIILLCIFINSIYNVIVWFNDNKKTEKIESEIVDNVEIETIDEGDIELINEPDDKSDIYYKYKDVSLIDVDIDSLKEENEDTVGWIQVSGTDINYPIVVYDNNEYYLKHDFLKNKNNRGWIFLDYRNDLDNLSSNNIIYGHRTVSGTMFGTLKNVLTSSWLSNTDYHVIKVVSESYSYLFQVFSVYTIESETYYLTTNFSNNNEYQKFLDTITSRSIHNFNTSINTNDKLLTLSSCTGDGTERLVVHAKLIKMTKK